MKIKCRKQKSKKYQGSEVCDYECQIKRYCSHVSCDCISGEYYSIEETPEKIEIEVVK